MKINNLKLKIIIIIFFLTYVFLTYNFSNELILNLQGYSDLHLIPIVFWLSILLVSINLLIADIGFLKIGAVLGIVTSGLLLVFHIVNNTTSFDMIASDKYELIVESVESSDNERINVYKKDGIFFSKYIGSVEVGNIYNSSYEIVEDSFIVTMCSVNSCITEEIVLE